MKIQFWISGYALIVSVTALAFILSVTLEPTPRDHLCWTAEVNPDMTEKEKERCRMLKLYSSGRTV
jgi:hypothetical protein